VSVDEVDAVRFHIVAGVMNSPWEMGMRTSLRKRSRSAWKSSGSNRSFGNSGSAAVPCNASQDTTTCRLMFPPRQATRYYSSHPCQNIVPHTARHSHCRV
jgi:hypothetical protein